MQSDTSAGRAARYVVRERRFVRCVVAAIDIVPIYPFEGTFVATHPACVNRRADAETQEAAMLFRGYLLGRDAQQLAVSSGLRPITGGVTIGSPLDEAHGVDLSQPKIVFDAPKVDALYAMEGVWQAARKAVNLVMLIDTSGSMTGAKIDGVRDAAQQFVKQMGDDDYLTLVAFSTEPEVLIQHQRVGAIRDDALAQIAALQADGNTSLYDAVGLAAELIAQSRSPQTANALVVLTDGKDTASVKFDFEPSLIDAAAANDTTVFTIAYGEDADRDLLSELASRANGNFYLGSVANIAEIYQEMSAAFGGSLGIGR